MATAPKKLSDFALYKPEIRNFKLKIFLYADAGWGKCFGFATRLISHDGSIVEVQDVQTGDFLLGPDSKPRRVLSTTKGRDQLYRITPVKGEPFVCNGAHVLCLRHSTKKHEIQVSVDDYFGLGPTDKQQYKLYRTGVDFDHKDVPYDPYVVGLWLGCGTKIEPHITKSEAETEVCAYLTEWAEKSDLSVTKIIDRNTTRWAFVTPRGQTNPFLTFVRTCVVGDEKRIPKDYLRNDRRTRLEMLAGLMDSDGYLNRGCFDIVTKYPGLAEDIVFLARSLGFAANRKEKRATIKSLDFEGVYHRVIISGDTSQIPCRLPRKQAQPRGQKKDVLVTGFSVEPIGEGDYYGFQLDGDHLFLLGDFTVSHNSTLAATANGHPLMKEVLFIGCEPGTLSISDESIIKCPRPTVIDFENFDWLSDLVWALRTDPGPYKTLVLDTFSELQKKSMDEWLETKWEREKKKAALEGRDPVFKNETLDDVFLEDWGKNTQHMRRIGRVLRDLPMHVILTAHVREDANMIAPSLTPKLAESIVSFMDVVGYGYWGRKDPDNKDSPLIRKLQVGSMPRYMTKDRSPGGKLGGTVSEPTLPKMLDMILAGTTDDKGKK